MRLRNLAIGVTVVAALIMTGGTTALARTPTPLAGVSSLTSGDCYRIIPTTSGNGNIAYNGAQHAFLTVTGGGYTRICAWHLTGDYWAFTDATNRRAMGYYNHGPVCGQQGGSGGGNCVTEQTLGTPPPSWQTWFVQNDGGGKFDITNLWVTDNPGAGCWDNSTDTPCATCFDSLGDPADADLNAYGPGAQIGMTCQDIPRGVYFEWFFYIG